VRETGEGRGGLEEAVKGMLCIFKAGTLLLLVAAAGIAGCRVSRGWSVESGVEVSWASTVVVRVLSDVRRSSSEYEVR